MKHPAFLDPLFTSPVTDELVRRITDAGHVSATGQWGSCALVLAAAVAEKTGRAMLIVTAHLDEADDASDQLKFFAPETKSAVFPAYEVLPGESNLSQELAAQRLELLDRLQTTGNKPQATGFVVAPVQALMQPVPNSELLKDQLWTVSPGQKLERDALVQWLSDHGYTRLDAVEDAGDFAVRGDIVDVWAPGEAEPVRVDFFGDEVESLHHFDIETLGPTADAKSVRLVALGEKNTWPTDRTTSLLSYLPADTIVWLIEPSEIQEQGRSYYDRLTDARGIYSPQTVLKNIQKLAWAEVHQFGATHPETIRLPCKSVQRFDTKPDEALKELAALAENRRVVVVCDNKSECTRLSDLLEVKHPGVAGKIPMPLGFLQMGFEWDEVDTKEARDADLSFKGSGARGQGSEDTPPSLTPNPLPLTPSALVVIGHHEIFHRHNQKRRLRAVQGARPIDSFLDLQTGDFVVHIQHGIAKYEGMTSIVTDGRASEYLTLKFSGDATLQVPATQIHLVQKYVGGAHGRPPLSVLGGSSWNKQKEKVAEAVEKMAGDLLEVQAAREHTPGIAYPGDTTWMKEFENSFPYQATEDQVRCIQEIKEDMAKPRPMDRLLCGDVGYGKTELAMRSAFKVCEYGKQVAVLVPTTVLAEQHEENFRERMREYPFVVESVSRFKTPAQVKKILERTRAGQVDVLIGTHRIISRDVKFADLGMVIIDEEQRFGVEHKERLKKLRLTVDVLTMTATPIPRTLHMSLLGIRDISNLATPPQDRRSVVTEVIPHDTQRIKQALQRELARNGQVYFVHNRIWNIQSVADELRQLVPDARILIGHGQMEEGQLEDVMHRFMRHEADILVSTTIIESGIDIATANTMFINQAENFGLSDLHQLRGRVGRSKHRAYCYLLLSPDKTITGTAAKRLKAMEEYASLGAGFKIALRDLEIRGAGNILGSEQSGHIAAVGYELYCQLLEEAVKRIKNQPIEKPKDVNVDIGLTGVLPKTYVSSDRQRMDTYRRLSRCHNTEQLEALTKDVVDAFGPMPKGVQTLFNIAEVKILAERFGITAISARDNDVIFKMEDLSKLGLLIGAKGPGSVRPVDEKTIYLRLPATYMEPETLLNVLRHMLGGKAAEAPARAEPQKPVAARR